MNLRNINIFFRIIEILRRRVLKLDNLVKYRLDNAQDKLESNVCDYDDFFIASKQDAELQLERAKEFLHEVKLYLDAIN